MTTIGIVARTVNYNKCSVLVSTINYVVWKFITAVQSVIKLPLYNCPHRNNFDNAQTWFKTVSLFVINPSPQYYFTASVARFVQSLGTIFKQIVRVKPFAPQHTPKLVYLSERFVEEADSTICVSSVMFTRVGQSPTAFFSVLSMRRASCTNIICLVLSSWKEWYSNVQL